MVRLYADSRPMKLSIIAAAIRFQYSWVVDTCNKYRTLSVYLNGFKGNAQGLHFIQKQRTIEVELSFAKISSAVKYLRSPAASSGPRIQSIQNVFGMSRIHMGRSLSEETVHKNSLKLPKEYQLELRRAVVRTELEWLFYEADVAGTILAYEVRFVRRRF